jgi:2-polyprenyl-3-methyl-5-hydroxy-6-metoxy-1,4-benzoquinol methylase
LIFSNLRNRDHQPELMDAPDLAPERYLGSLRGLSRVNAVTGSAKILWPEILAAARATPGKPLRVLDVACGGGDVPIALLRRVRAQRLPVVIDGCDVNSIAVQQATERAKSLGVSATFFQLNVLEDALPDDYDIVMSSLFLHHLSGNEARDFLSNAADAARRLVLIHDLVRCRAGLWLAQIGMRVLFCNDVCVHDGPRSVEGAFTVEEMRRLALDAGLDACRIEARFPYRFLLQWSPDEAPA